jgi:hypothetical protein
MLSPVVAPNRPGTNCLAYPQEVARQTWSIYIIIIIIIIIIIVVVVVVIIIIIITNLLLCIIIIIIFIIINICRYFNKALELCMLKLF